MQFYIDSSNMNEISEIYDSGILSGVTTNPSLLKEAIRAVQIDSIDCYIKKLLTFVGENVKVSLQVIGNNPKADAMIAEGKKLYEKFNLMAGNVVIKIPVNPSINERNEYALEGLKAIKALSRDGIPINTTLIMNVEQALQASYAGASYVSPFVGRVDDYLREEARIKFDKWDYFPKNGIFVNDNGVVSGVNLVEKIIEEFDKRNLDTKVLAASVRNVKQAWELFNVGADIGSLPYKVFKESLIDFIPKVLKHPKTFEGAKKFVDDVPEEYKKLLE